MKNGFTRDVVDEVEADDHRDRVHRSQAHETPYVEPGDLDIPGLAELAEKNGPDQITADHEEQVDAHVAAARPLGPAAGCHSDGLGGERPEMEQHDVIRDHPEDGEGPDAIDHAIVEFGPDGQRLPVASKIEQTEIRRLFRHLFGVGRRGLYPGHPGSGYISLSR